LVRSSLGREAINKDRNVRWSEQKAKLQQERSKSEIMVECDNEYGDTSVPGPSKFK
jgi:hypothetical protein